jgi:replicative DNA helicase
MYFDLKAEQAVLGCMVHNAHCAEICVSTLKVSHFYSEAHRKLFGLLSEMCLDGGCDDEILVVDWLTRTNLLESVGGREYVGKIFFQPGLSVANVENYCRLVLENAQKRDLLGLCERISSELGTSTGGEIIATLEASVAQMRMNASGVDESPSDLHELASLVASEALAGEAVEYTGLKCGVAGGALDELIDGIQPRHYYVLAARTGQGKSTLVEAIMRGVVRCNPGCGQPLMITTEMAPEGIAIKALAAAAGVHTRGIVRRNLTSDQRAKVLAVVQNKELQNIKVKFMCGATVSQVATVAKAHKRQHGLPLLVIDLAGQLSAPGEDDRVRLSNISAGLARLKVELDTCIIACVQLNRSVNQGPDKRPSDGQIKGSGSWEEDCDKLLYIYRPSNSTKTELIHFKDRDHGNTGSIWVEYLRATGEYRATNGE